MLPLVLPRRLLQAGSEQKSLYVRLCQWALVIMSSGSGEDARGGGGGVDVDVMLDAFVAETVLDFILLCLFNFFVNIVKVTVELEQCEHLFVAYWAEQSIWMSSRGCLGGTILGKGQV